MNKKDVALLVVLISLVLMWPMIGPKLEQQFFPKPAVEPVTEEFASSPEKPPVVEFREMIPDRSPSTLAADSSAVDVEHAVVPETTARLSNDLVSITLSSRGATVKSVTLNSYQTASTKDSDLIELDFTDRLALAYSGLRGFGEADDFSLNVSTDARTATMERREPWGVSLIRKIELESGYQMKVSDTFINEFGQPVTLPPHGIQLGMMESDPGKKVKGGVYYLGVDALLVGGKGVTHYGKKTMPKALKGSGLTRLEQRSGEPVDWLAVKSRFFVQIVTPKGGADDAYWYAERMNANSKQLQAVAGTVMFSDVVIQSEAPLVRESTFYVGPKKYSEINQYGRHQWRIMEFGMFAPICKFLLWVLNFIHDILWPYNYGVAIILLTVIIRILFWPITHKGTESMRRMQDIQPLMKEIREKHKDNPQKQQQAMMGLYKEHKINPIGGCLPMLIQLPVFFALFVVLRSAIELRFASFLWIRDLSEPENLFSNVLPIGLNILPIIMAVTMVWQQKLTPTTADPRQAKMMQFMPVMMLFLFYTFAAGLVLYWTVSQCLMIIQQLLYQKRKEQKTVLTT